MPTFTAYAPVCTGNSRHPATRCNLPLPHGGFIGLGSLFEFAFLSQQLAERIMHSGRIRLLADDLAAGGDGGVGFAAFLLHRGQQLPRRNVPGCEQCCPGRAALRVAKVARFQGQQALVVPGRYQLGVPLDGLRQA